VVTITASLQPRARDQRYRFTLRIDHLLIIGIIATREEVYLATEPITSAAEAPSEAGNEENDYEIHAARRDRRPEYR
jgi:hypothetical protein